MVPFSKLACRILVLAAFGSPLAAEAASVRDVCIAAAAPPVLDPRRSPFEGARLIGREELAKLLTANTLRTLSSAPPRVFDVDYLETFGPGARWLSTGGRTGHSGAYAIIAGQLCVEIQGSPTPARCRVLWIGKGGHYFTVESRGDSRLSIEAVAVEMKGANPGSPAPTC